MQSEVPSPQSETPALDDRLYESYRIRAAGWISLSGCQPNRVQLTMLVCGLTSSIVTCLINS
jgi:hypothetical protein